jgi:hypothetical protein
LPHQRCLTNIREPYLRGAHEGDCDERTGVAQGKGEAKGDDIYAGEFVRGRPDDQEIYTSKTGAPGWNFRQGKAHGSGVYVGAKRVRYEGQFVNGKLEAMNC